MDLITDTPGPARVVVSDREPSVREGVCNILVEEGFEVSLSTGDALTAGRTIADNHPELAILGLDGEGFGGAWQVEDMSMTDEVALVALSSTTVDSVVIAQTAGAVALLPKPVSRAEFAPAVHIALARFLQRRRNNGARQAG